MFYFCLEWSHMESLSPEAVTCVVFNNMKLCYKWPAETGETVVMHLKLMLRKLVWDWGKLVRLTYEARFVFVLTLFLLVRDSLCTVSETRRPLSGFTGPELSLSVRWAQLAVSLCPDEVWSPRAVRSTLPRRKHLCAQVTKNLLGSRVDMGVVSKRTIPPLPGIEQLSFSKFTDWGIPTNGYYKSVTAFVKYACTSHSSYSGSFNIKYTVLFVIWRWTPVVEFWTPQRVSCIRTRV
jgi:hypothetical protein